ncbi:tricarballylate utilization 4Fe-4S protein TcuB [Rhodobacteraceae bacterium RKSG542]|uniref:tricarballylate utilization 4Fe-4S protein TcuB n=1 Tax=Pseudovibrio flavus TaxID=2529854 RepID=UPI0012BC8201|nr:tricarballylate utilization 4Fe-4S protein TcuB [Pseudovibrio flavus]MTI18119.1 tricarballylate utilization 4Fe-4S protein TcuB [Pseudovibrio flavus]
MHLTEALKDADRIMSICNACRYCEGHCAVFPAMEKRLEFNPADLNYLANLCHNCGSCYHHCQYADPHEFDVNVPKTFSKVRTESYGEYAWPPVMKGIYKKNGYWVAGIGSAAVIGFTVLTSMIVGGAAFFSPNPEGFYGIMPHNVMAGIFGFVAIFALFALFMGIARFWSAIGLPSPLGLKRAEILQAIHDALTLKYMGGGNSDGCTYPDEKPSKWRRRFHHMTFYGFMLCFAATSAGTIMHYLAGLHAPYDFTSLPKILGSLGGIGLLIGPAGLLWLKGKADDRVKDENTTSMDIAFLVLLFMVSLTGFALVFLGGTSLLGLALTVHLGFVATFFLTVPYGKFTHGFYRLVALIAHAYEEKNGKALPVKTETKMAA